MPPHTIAPNGRVHIHHLSTDIVRTVRSMNTQREAAALLAHQLVLLAVDTHDEGARGMAPRTPRLTRNSTWPTFSRPNTLLEHGPTCRWMERISIGTRGTPQSNHPPRESLRDPS